MNTAIKVTVIALALFGVGSIAGSLLTAVAGAGTWIMLPLTLASGAALLFTATMFLKHVRIYQVFAR